jgi:hypothetical protein
MSKRPVILYLTEITNNGMNRVNIEGLAPTSGSEPKYDPDKWNLNQNIKGTHNCYAYVINKVASKRKGKPQPGYFAGYPPLSHNDYNCNTFLERLKADIPTLYKSTFNKPCKKGFHKGFLAYDPKSDHDYHFYRQDSRGSWSHKPGTTDVVNTDAAGDKIFNPGKANRSYSYYKYTSPCFYFCVNPKMAHLHSKQSS